jgi:hypothetical protein
MGVKLGNMKGEEEGGKEKGKGIRIGEKEQDKRKGEN